MGKLNEYMKKVVEEQKLGFVATVCADGSPNLSPKGTCLVLDDDHIMFGDIRSPNTRRNLEQRPTLEINFVDQFARKGFRAKGPATYVERGTAEFDELRGRFAQWGELSNEIKGIVKMKVERALPLATPAYELGATEEGLRAHWKDYFMGLESSR